MPDPTDPTVPPSPASRLRSAGIALVLVAAVASGHPAGAQDGTTPPTTATSIEGGTVPSTAPTTTSTTTLPVPDPADPTQGEGVGAEPVPIDPGTVPPRPPGSPGGAEVGVALRTELGAVQASALRLGASYAVARQRTVELEAELDRVERAVTSLAGADRTAVRRIEAARRHFESRAVAATIRGRIDDFVPNVPSGDPNDLAAAHTLLTAVLAADQAALDDYLAARAGTDAELLATADRLVTTRSQLREAREAMIEARRRNVSAQISLAVLAAGSDIVINGFVFPVGDPHTFGDSFGAPRMVGTEYVHAHQGTDILAPQGTPLFACERGIITKMGSDILGGTTLWLKGESGTYYYYAHLSRYADGITKGAVVEPGAVVGHVGDTGNARGGPPHLHFEIHPGGGPAVNPYPLLKVVDRLTKQTQGG